MLLLISRISGVDSNYWQSSERTEIKSIARKRLSAQSLTGAKVLILGLLTIFDGVKLSLAVNRMMSGPSGKDGEVLIQVKNASRIFLPDFH